MKIEIDTEAGIRSAITRAQDMLERGVQRGKVMLIVRAETRTDRQNRRFHAQIGDIHEQGWVPDANGELRRLADGSREKTKAALVDAFAQEMGNMGEPLRHPGAIAWNWICRNFVYERPSTTQFTASEADQFIEFLASVGADMDVHWSRKAQESHQCER